MGGIPLDIVIFAVVAVMLIGKLVTILGKRTGNEDTVRPNRFQFGKTDATKQPHPDDGAEDAMLLDDPLQIDDAKRQSNRAAAERGESFATLPANIQKVIRDIAKLDRDFETHEFIEGAGNAYEAIIKAYAEGNRKMLHMLLTQEVYDSFVHAIEEREAKGWVVKDVLASELKARIINAKLMSQKIATIEVEFISEQYNSIYDKEGQLLEGSPQVANQIHENWSFIRDLTLTDPNWKLAAVTDVES